MICKKMGRHQLHILFFLLSSFAPFSNIMAQEPAVIRGVVMERGTSNRISSAQIINKKTQAAVLSNDFGLFQISGSTGDTLIVLKIEFSDLEIAASSDKDLVISLSRGSTTLREVNITGQSKKQELNEIKKEFKNKGSFYSGKPPLLSYIFSPLTAAYELFGRTPKNARRFGKYYTTEVQQTEIDGLFNERLVQNNTPLEGKALEDFMLNYRPDYEQAKKWTEYDAVKYIKDSYKRYANALEKK